jgi:transcriptional regulator with XRE-family HTH domain
MAGNHPLRKFRLSQKPALTQEALGKELGVTGQTIWRWESGDRQIGRNQLVKITKRTGIPARQLRPDLAKYFEAAE